MMEKRDFIHIWNRSFVLLVNYLLEQNFRRFLPISPDWGKWWILWLPQINQFTSWRPSTPGIQTEIAERLKWVSWMIKIPDGHIPLIFENGPDYSRFQILPEKKCRNNWWRQGSMLTMFNCWQSSEWFKSLILMAKLRSVAGSVNFFKILNVMQKACDGWFNSWCASLEVRRLPIFRLVCRFSVVQ